MAYRAEPNLDRDQLVAAAFAVLEEAGLDGLSMRRLAARLGVQAPALYWHVSDKGELLGLMARDIYHSAFASVGPAADWGPWLIGFGRALRSSFAAHRDGARLCASAHPPAGPEAAARTTEITAQLMAMGLDQGQALRFQASVISLALGWAMFEANEPMRAYLGDMMDIERSFEDGLLALVQGLKQAFQGGR